MESSLTIQQKMNQFGRRGEPFVFLVGFDEKKSQIFNLNDSSEILWEIRGKSNHDEIYQKKLPQKWEMSPVPFEEYKKGFELVKQHILSGDTYLLNYTKPTKIETDLTLEEIYGISSAPYKIYLKNHFVCFSPESFITIEDGKISSFPMKGTIDAGIENAEQKVLNDSKEIAEHNTIVDLIRNDLSLVAENVKVEKFRYLGRITTNQKNLWQVSSKITGDLPENHLEKLGDILFAMLPAGSVSGAPKKKTVEIIRKAEDYNRGFYTGIFGVFDGKNLDSCVLIRFIENNNGQLVYKSGGGITFMSEPEKEYDELLKKVYVPVD